MKVVYVAGKLTDPRGQWYEQANTQVAMMVAVDLWKMGFSVICPHANTYFMGGAVPYEAFLAGDFEIIRRSDAVVMVPNWEQSPGARREKQEAEKEGIPVYHWPQHADALRVLAQSEEAAA